MRTNKTRTGRAWRRAMVLALLALMLPGCDPIRWFFPVAQLETAPVEAMDSPSRDRVVQAMTAPDASAPTAG